MVLRTPFAIAWASCAAYILAQPLVVEILECFEPVPRVCEQRPGHGGALRRPAHRHHAAGRHHGRPAGEHLLRWLHAWRRRLLPLLRLHPALHLLNVDAGAGGCRGDRHRASAGAAAARPGGFDAGGISFGRLVDLFGSTALLVVAVTLTTTLLGSATAWLTTRATRRPTPSRATWSTTSAPWTSAPTSSAPRG